MVYWDMQESSKGRKKSSSGASFVLALRRRLPAQHAALASAMAFFLVHASPVDTLDDLCTGFYIGLVSSG